jgi:photosystem II stability/assembly factor-like uncharacterized protein
MTGGGPGGAVGRRGERERGGGRRPVAPHRLTLLYLGTASGVLTLRRRGAYWLPLHDSLPGRVVRALAVAPEAVETLYAAGDDTLYRSTDGGAHWQPIGQPRPSLPITALLVTPRPAARVLVGLRPTALVHGPPDGAQWRPAHLPATDADGITRLLAPGGEAGHLYAVAGGRILLSEDGGLTWGVLEALRAPVTALVPHPETPATLYAAGPAGLFRTRNAGRAWQRLLGGTVTAVLVHPDRPRTLIAARPDGLHQSVNAGVQWAPMPGGESEPDDPVVALLGTGDGLLAVARHGRLRQAIDGEWRAPVMGPLPPVLAGLTVVSEISAPPGTLKRTTPRRRRPKGREGGGEEPTPPPAAARPGRPPERRPQPPNRDA